MQLETVYVYDLERRDTPAGRLLLWEGLGLKWGSGINCAVGSGFREITKGSSMVECEKAMNVCFQEGMFIPLIYLWKFRLSPIYCYSIFLPFICTWRYWIVHRNLLSSCFASRAPCWRIGPYCPRPGAGTGKSLTHTLARAVYTTA